MEWVVHLLTVSAAALWSCAIVMARLEDKRAAAAEVEPTPDRRKDVTPISTHISPEVRAELDETPEWWDKRFHEALRAVETPILHGEPEYFEERTLDGRVAWHQTFQAVELPSCTCEDCKRARAYS
jgi:hypothetical protein